MAAAAAVAACVRGGRRLGAARGRGPCAEPGRRRGAAGFPATRCSCHCWRRAAKATMYRILSTARCRTTPTSNSRGLSHCSCTLEALAFASCFACRRSRHGICAGGPDRGRPGAFVIRGPVATMEARQRGRTPRTAKSSSPACSRCSFRILVLQGSVLARSAARPPVRTDGLARF